MKVFYITANNGDGSSTTEFWDSQECIDYLIDDDRCDERYMDGDGGSYGFFEVPDGTEIKGIRIRSLDNLPRSF